MNIFLLNALAMRREPSYTPILNEWYGLLGHAYPFKKLVS